MLPRKVGHPAKGVLQCASGDPSRSLNVKKISKMPSQPLQQFTDSPIFKAIAVEYLGRFFDLPIEETRAVRPTNCSRLASASRILSNI